MMDSLFVLMNGTHQRPCDAVPSFPRCLILIGAAKKAHVRLSRSSRELHLLRGTRSGVYQVRKVACPKTIINVDDGDSRRAGV
jgi:hypothetical protein